MKKSIFIAFGLLFIGASIIPFTSASRDTYHAWLMEKAQKNAAKDAQYYHPFEKTTQGKATLSRYFRNTMQRDLNLTPIETTTEKEGYESFRINSAYNRGSNRLSSIWTNPLRRTAVVFRRIKNAVTEFNTYTNDTFKILVPKGWDEDAKMVHFFSSKKSEYTIFVKKFENDCQNISFTTCAISLSNNENRLNTEGRLTVSSIITRQTQFQNTVQTSSLQTRTLLEGFTASLEGNDYYISRFFVADIDGGIYMVETRSSLKNASGYIGVSKAIFDSFQILTEKEATTPTIEETVVPTTIVPEEKTDTTLPKTETPTKEIPAVEVK